MQNKNLKLIVAGEFYEDEKPYLDLIDKYNLSESVILATNFIPDDEVVNYFCAADIIVQPYRNATQSGVTQIAYHFERPMLVTNVGGLAEIVPHNRVGYVTSQEPKDIADAIIDFYKHNKEAEFTLNTKQEKKRFSWESFVDGVDELINSVNK